MNVLGFIFGLAGLSFAIIAWLQIDSLKKEFDELKKDLGDSGALKKQEEPDN